MVQNQRILVHVYRIKINSHIMRISSIISIKIIISNNNIIIITMIIHEMMLLMLYNNIQNEILLRMKVNIPRINRHRSKNHSITSRTTTI